MIEIGPVAEDLFGRTHEPQQEVDVVRRLVHQHATAFSVPAAAPGVLLVVRRVAPHLGHRLAEQQARAHLALVNRLAYALGGREPAPLGHGRNHRAVFRRCFQDAVGVLERRREWFLDDTMNAALGGQHQRIGVLGVRRADTDDVDLAGVEHGPRRGVLVLHAPAFCKIPDAARVHVADGHQLGVVAQRRQSGRVCVGDAASANNAEANLRAHRLTG